MTKAKVKSIEKAQRSPESSSPSRAIARQPSVGISPGGFDAALAPQTAGNLAVQQLFRAGAIQAKLAISQPGDPDEQEADRVADQVVSSAPVGMIQRKCVACAEGTPCPKCEGEQKVQTKELTGHTPCVTPNVESSLATLRGGGQPLPPSVRASFEPRFGADFSQVRVHTDGQAAESASAIQAKAFTIGRDVVFGAGRYEPQSQAGQRLLAHELAHVVQQGAGFSAQRIQRQGGIPSVTPNVADAQKSTKAKNEQPNIVKPPEPKGELVVHTATNVTFTDSPEYVRFQLQSFVALNSTDRLGSFESPDAVYQFGGGLGPFLDPPNQPISDVRTKYKARVVSLVRSEVITLRSKIASFLSDFERRAVDKLNEMLDASKTRVEKERQRYDVKKEGSGHSVETGKLTEDLTRRSRDLLGKQAAVVSAKAELGRAQPYGPHGELPPGGAPKQEEQDKEVAARDKLAEVQRVYNLARSEAERHHPILVSYQLDPLGPVTAERLGKLGSTSSATQAETLAAEIDNKLDSIKDLRKKVLGNWAKVWNLYAVIEATKMYADIQLYPGLLAGVRGTVLAEKVGALQAEAELTALFTGIAMLVVGLVAAVPTGGLSLGVTGVVAGAGAAEAGLMAFTAYQATEKFRFDLAASGTDFDKAKAISEEEPSLFWLALDIVGALVSLPKGLSSFRKLVGMRRMAVAAKVGGRMSEAEDLLKAIENEGNKASKSGTGGTSLSKQTNDLAVARVKHAPEFAEIEQNLAKKRPSTMPGYTEEIPLKGDHYWRKGEKGWCRFSDIPMFCFEGGSIEGTALEEQLIEFEFERTSRETLRKNIIKSGMPLPSGEWQGHHIVPWQLQNHPVVVFVRDKFGWSMNSIENAVPLVTKSEEAGALAGKVATHSGSHASYTMEIANDLDKLQERWNTYSPNKTYSEFQKILDQNRARMIRDLGGKPLR